MFTIMENRKRPRLELINSNNNSSNEALQGVASTTTPLGTATATLATIGGQSFILSNASATSLPANILLSICDDNSDESEEYIIDSPMLTHIKQENSVATQTTNNQTTQQLPALVTSLPQYRIVNQAGKSLNNSPLNSPNVLNTSAVANNAALLSNSVHLPPGCEIYVIKEVLDTPKQVLQNDTTVSSNKGIVNTNATTTTTIKLEPMSPLPILRNSTTLNNNTSQNLNANSNNITITTNPVTTAHNTTLSTSPQDETAKRSLILEAYKKRDDKRRATHNEVERRRRDKINSWIFKLKEMLPTEVTPSNGSTILNKEAITNTAHQQQQQQQQQQQRLLLQQQATTRTPPSDSKSQILIKACEYIKSMQEEIKSLRECLTENESLRLNNERLQDEINTLRSKQQQQQQKQHLNNNNNNILLTTTTTTNNNNNNNSNNSNNNNNHNNNNNNNNNHSNTTDDCEITLNTLNTTYANVQLFAPSTTQHNNNNNHHNHNNHHHLAGLVGLTTNTSSPATVNVTYAKRELIITDFVD